MPVRSYYIFLLVIAAFCCTGSAQQIVEPLPASSYGAIESMLPKENIFGDSKWFNWGASVITGDDGKYHMFYSRWPRKYSFYSWLTHSEIAHAVADKPQGPYKYVETAITCKGDSNWDKFTAHNPKIKKFNGKYYLYYIGTYAELSEEELIETAKTGYSHKNWKPLRENQRTGVAVSDSLSGPWKRSKKPIIEPAGPITTLTVNPAVTQGPDGTYFMIIKGDKPGTTKFVRNQALATSDKPDGPFKIHPKPVIDTFDTEDASMWYDKNNKKFYAVYHAHTHIGLIESADGYNWKKATPNILANKTILFTDGKTFKPDRMERPFVMLDENGIPSFLFVSAKKGSNTMNIHLPIVWPKK